MVSGIFDIMSHLMEQYFSGDDDNTSDYLMEGVYKNVVRSARVAVQDPTNYEARSNIMWCATMALNGLFRCSKEQDWEVHMIEHQLGAYTNCSHGMGLCAISMPYYRYIYKYGIDKFVRFAKELWNVDDTGKTKDEVALEGIARMEQFAKDCGMVTTLKELGATQEMLPKIANTCVLKGGYKKLTREEILEILKQCYELLNSYMFKPKELNKLLKETCKLFCLGYIKPYLYIFIKTFDDEKFKSEDESRKKIIDVINEDNSIYKMMRIYIFKIIYNKFRIDAFTDEKMIEKYKINDYRDFDCIEIKDLNNIYKIDFYKALKEDYYIDSYKIIEKYKKNEFKDKLKTSDYDIEEYGIDNFYVLSYNISFTNLQMEKSEINKNFYTNICQPLFKDDQLLSEAIKLFYDPTKYSTIKKRFNISSENIKPLLFSYRYCLNELSSKNKRGIYYPLYDISNINYLKEQYYPGNDTKYNKVYSHIINHFKTKPNEGCYVCLCKKQYYRSVKAGFPNHIHLNMKCPKCREHIGMVEEGVLFKEKKIVKRNSYIRIAVGVFYLATCIYRCT